MILQNPIKYLLEHYYIIKYKQKNKKYKNKNIQFYIGVTYGKTARNKKFKSIQKIFNPFTTFYLKRNIYSLKQEEIIKILDHIDEVGIINNPRYDLEEYTSKEPMNKYQFYALKNYNFYDSLFFEYASHKDRDVVFEQLKEFEISKLKISFK
tara:strand:- start:654 stop:1109 length:456 start_codon:yes stop_codon:yes gene_type:complete